MCDEFYDDDGGENFASDPDNQYDIMRDDSVCELSQDITKLKRFYVDKPTQRLSYYSNNLKRFWEHIKSDAEYELKKLEEDLKCKQTNLKT